MVTLLNEEELALWRSFLFTSMRVLDAVHADLRVDSGLAGKDYEVLAILSEAPGRQLRMAQLADSVVQPRSQLTQRLDRLEKRGWIKREAAAVDKRGAYAVLTDEGFRVLLDAVPDHVASVRRHLLDHLTPEQIREGAAILEAVPVCRKDRTEAD